MQRLKADQPGPVEMPEVTFRRAAPGDLPAILKIQTDNYIGNLPVERQGQGFLSAEFTPGQFAEMAGDIGIIVASQYDSVVGFLCGFRREFDHRSPVIAKMVDSFDRLRFQGKALASYKTFIYGPVCVERACRGRGLLRGLYQALKREAAGEFDVGVVFVARNNPYSLRAHVEGLKMAEIGEFSVRDSVYAVLAFPTR